MPEKESGLHPERLSHSEQTFVNTHCTLFTRICLPDLIKTLKYNRSLRDGNLHYIEAHFDFRNHLIALRITEHNV